ncbi:transcriptional regulator, partial [Halorubrum sp. SP3]
SHTYSPLSADTVADNARTAPKTARKHLSTLADEGFVETTPGEHGSTRYRRSPESLVMEQASDILEHVSTDELVARIQEMREQLTECQTEFGVESPEALAVNQTNQALAESGVPQEEIDPERIREWKTLRRNLAFANAALSIGTAEQFVDDDRRSTDENVPA